MSERIAKVQSLVRQTVAAALLEQLGPQSAYLTVTAVDVSPDLRQATVWLGSLSDNQQADLQAVEVARHGIQQQLNKVMTTKFVPHLTFKLDHGGEYADHISRLLKDS